MRNQGSRLAEPGFDRLTEDPCFGATWWAGTPKVRLGNHHRPVLASEHQHLSAGYLRRVAPAASPQAVHHLEAEPVLKQAEPRLAEREHRRAELADRLPDELADDPGVGPHASGHGGAMPGVQ